MRTFFQLFVVLFFFIWVFFSPFYVSACDFWACFVPSFAEQQSWDKDILEQLDLTNPVDVWNNLTPDEQSRFSYSCSEEGICSDTTEKKFTIEVSAGAKCDGVQTLCNGNGCGGSGGVSGSCQGETCYCTASNKFLAAAGGACGDWQGAGSGGYEVRWCNEGNARCTDTDKSGCYYQIRPSQEQFIGVSGPPTGYVTDVTGGYIPDPELCGNEHCDSGESCFDCPQDCGSCSSADITAYSVVSPDAATLSCTDLALKIPTANIAGSYTLAPYTKSSIRGEKMSTVWKMMPVLDAINGTKYSISSILGTHKYVQTCVSAGGVDYISGNEGMLKSASTLKFLLAYTPPGPWTQTNQGNVYTGKGIFSYIPALLRRNYFNLWDDTLTSTTPFTDKSSAGIVQYGSDDLGDYDFSVDESNKMEASANYNKWLIQEKKKPKDSVISRYFTLRNHPDAVP